MGEHLRAQGRGCKLAAGPALTPDGNEGRASDSDKDNELVGGGPISYPGPGMNRSTTRPEDGEVAFGTAQRRRGGPRERVAPLGLVRLGFGICSFGDSRAPLYT